MDLNNKRVLVTGGTGMIGQEVVNKVLQRGGDVIVASNEDENRLGLDVEYVKCDLRDFETCKQITKNIDVVFNMVGVKGSPKMTKERPASFFVPMLQFDTNMMEAARLNDVGWFLFTSSVGVYGDFESPEDKVWDDFPSPNDWYAGWAKRMGELQASAYSTQYGWDRVSIIRPANVFGKYDNFNPETGMVIPSLMARIESGEDPLVVWGDGSNIRDFIYAGDVAEICCFLVENEITSPVNAGRGWGITIKDVVTSIVETTDKNPDVVWDTTKPSGDKKRVLNVERLKKLGFENYTAWPDALRWTWEWYKEHKETVDNRYNPFIKV